MLARLAIAGLLLAHAAIHIAFVAPAPAATADGPPWPFTTDDSWLFSRVGVGSTEARLVATALVAVTLAAFALAALVAVGLAPVSVWMPAVAIGAVASLGLLVAFFHPWLVVGVAIDIGLLAASLVGGWTPVEGGPAI